MTLRHLWRHALGVCLLCSATAVAQEPSTPPRAAETDPTEVAAIVVDVVVRDRQGNPVTDLTAEELEIYEDGVRQEIGSFRIVAEPAEAAGTPAARSREAATADPPLADRGLADRGLADRGAATASATPAEAGPEILALVFDRLSPEARALAHEAALGYVGDGYAAKNVTAVFGVDLSLVLYQPFTRDPDRIRGAIEAAGGRSTAQFGETRAAQRAASEELARSSTQAASLGNGAGGGPGGAQAGQAAGAAGRDQAIAEVQQRMLESFEALERDQQGYATANALMAVATAMRAIPGRKSVVFFSEGLSIPPNVQARFASVIDAANRANVTIYPMDAAGLRTESTLEEAREGVTAASERTVNRNPTQDVTGRPMMAALERNEDLLRADPHSGLGTLADLTGGFLIASSNDLRSGFRRIDTDMRNYYVLTYVPSDTDFDGSFREIDVKARRPGVRVRARKGYYAVRAPAGSPVLAHEAPALAALERMPVPNDFAARAVTLQFPEARRPGLAPVLVTVPTAGVTFRPSEADEEKYTSDVLVLVRFRDEGDEVVETMSQHYQIEGPVEQMARASEGEVLFYRQPELAPGVYAMETVVYDALSDKATVRFATVDVAEVDPAALRLSSLVWIRRSEQVPEREHVPGSPLYVGDHLLYPNMGEPFSKASGTELPFYFVIYPSADAGEVSGAIELLGSGQPLAEAPLEVGPADEEGRIAQIGRLPVDALEPGTYELRVTVRQGQQAVSRSLSFRVVP